jgi:hypothetical protein
LATQTLPLNHPLFVSHTKNYEIGAHSEQAFETLIADDLQVTEYQRE